MYSCVQVYIFVYIEIKSQVDQQSKLDIQYIEFFVWVKIGK